MIVIACVDDNGGMLFNNRRQSRDRTVVERILKLVGNDKLWISHYSNKLFEELPCKNINIDDSFLTEATEDDYCFVEGQQVAPYEQWVKKIILFKWNRSYPSDVSFDIPVGNDEWKLSSTEDFEGNSHEKITMEVYER